MGVSQDGRFIMENPIKMDADWGYPILGHLHMIFMDPIKDVFATPFRFRIAVAKSEASTNFLFGQLRQHSFPGTWLTLWLCQNSYWKWP